MRDAMRWTAQYRALVEAMRSALPTGDGRQILAAVQSWLAASLPQFTQRLRTRYRLDELAQLPLDDYPIRLSKLNFVEEAQQLISVAPSSEETLLMRVRDLLWNAITAESHVQCPNCDSAALRVLRNADSAELVLECDRCPWAQTLPGERWERKTKFLPPTIEELSEAGVLQEGRLKI